MLDQDQKAMIHMPLGSVYCTYSSREGDGLSCRVVLVTS